MAYQDLAEQISRERMQKPWGKNKLGLLRGEKEAKDSFPRGESVRGVVGAVGRDQTVGL